MLPRGSSPLFCAVLALGLCGSAQSATFKVTQVKSDTASIPDWSKVAPEDSGLEAAIESALGR